MLCGVVCVMSVPAIFLLVAFTIGARRGVALNTFGARNDASVAHG